MSVLNWNFVKSVRGNANPLPILSEELAEGLKLVLASRNTFSSVEVSIAFRFVLICAWTKANESTLANIMTFFVKFVANYF